MVSEVIFPRFWGVFCIEKCFRIFVSVIGSAVSEMSRFAYFYVRCKDTAIIFIRIIATRSRAKLNGSWFKKGFSFIMRYVS